MLRDACDKLKIGVTLDVRRSPSPGGDRGAAQAAIYAVVANARGILLDWDGCVVVGNRILPAARQLLARHGDRVVIVSNNSTHLPEQFSAYLARAGLILPASHIILAGAEAVSWVAQARDPGRVMVLGSLQMRALALRLGVNVVRDNPNMVLLMRDTRFGYSQMARAVSALHRGARLVVSNADRTHPGVKGDIVPETGALLAALTTCVPGIIPFIIGKPERLLFERACAVLGIANTEALMIGDNSDTDIAGAKALGIRSLQVWPQALEDHHALVPFI
jgi:4-nitrophenyl phosphatase